MHTPLFPDGASRFIALATTTFALLTYTSHAHAQAGHRHDGVYLRLGLGVGYLVDGLKSDPIAGVGRLSGTAAGGALTTEVAIGGFVTPGVAIAAGLYSSFASPIAKRPDVGDGQLGENVEFESSSAHLLGPVVDYYLDPDGGFHLQGALGLSWISGGRGFGDRTNIRYVERNTWGGVGLMFGVGHEWWVSRKWSLGILGRVTMGSHGGDDDNGVGWRSNVITPGLLFSATLN